MAFPTVQSATGNNSGANTTSQVITFDGGTAVGDRVLVFITNDGGAGMSVTSGTGWAQLFQRTVDGVTARLTCFWKDWDGSGDNLTLDCSASEGLSWAIVAIEAGTFDDTTDPEVGTASFGTSDSPDPPSLNPTNWDVEDTLWIASYGWDGNVAHSAYPTNYSSNQFTTRWANTGGAGVAVATRNNAAASEDPGVGTLASSEQWAAQTVAIAAR